MDWSAISVIGIILSLICVMGRGIHVKMPQIRKTAVLE